MANEIKHNTECGPFIACGAAAVSFDHQPGEPTSVDRVAAAIKHLFTGKRTRSAAQADRTVATVRSF